MSWAWPGSQWTSRAARRYLGEQRGLAWPARSRGDMPEPVRRGQRYLPGLDGLRALAVLAVIAYHLGLSWAPGGLIGVGVFFTLSGYLITDLLLGHWRTHGRLGLGDFWLRRARRLLPALFVMLAVVVAWSTLMDRPELGALRGGVIAAATYVSNWWLIVAHQSYFSRFGPPSPLGHLWSLAVEEQFYLVWPWLLWLGLWCVGGRRGPRPAREGRLPGRFLLAAATMVLAAASALEMALLYHPGLDPTRVYDGTDTRAFSLLVGAALAMVWPSRRPGGPPGERTRRILDGAGVAGLAVIGVMVWRTNEYSPLLYRGGLVMVCFATAAVVAAVAAEGSRLGPALGGRLLRWLGVRSYGIYLWHYPVIVLTTPARGGENPLRAGAQVAVSIALAAVSWRFVEEPIRHGALARARARVRDAGWQPGSLAPRAWAGGAAVCTVAVLAGVGLIQGPPVVGSSDAISLSASGSRPAGRRGLASPSLTPPPWDLAIPPGAWGLGVVVLPSQRRMAVAAGAAGPGPRTSCAAVTHIGDSTSEGMVSADYLPSPAQRLPAQYARVGVSSWHLEISGGRSIVETLDGQPNAYEVAQSLVQRGYHGCWVLALGTNDTADVAVGSPVGRSARIARMMAVAGGEPVLWINVKSLVTSGPYAEANMRLWNRALLRACARYPNMRVFDWAAVAKDSWFITDGIHYTSAGYAARARLIADALALAFPASGAGPGCLVP